jgi:hypothetical protein
MPNESADNPDSLFTLILLDFPRTLYIGSSVYEKTSSRQLGEYSQSRRTG